MVRKEVLTNSQKGIYLSCLNETLAYNIPMLFELDKEVSIEKAKEAFEKIFKAHPSLNTHLLKEKGEIYQTYDEASPIIELKEIDNLDKTSLVKPFDLFGPRLYRIAILKITEKTYIFIDIHHIIFDGFSVKKLLDEFALLVSGKEINNEEYSLLDYAIDEAKEKSDKTKLEECKKYFADKFGSVDMKSNLIDDKKDSKPSIGRKKIRFDKLTNNFVNEALKKLGVSRTAFFETVFSYTLSIFSGDDEVFYSTVNNGRNAKVKDSFGMYVKTMPIYLNFSKFEKVADCFKSIDEQLIANIDNSLYSFVDFSSDFDISTDILFSYQGDNYYEFEIDGKLNKVEFVHTKDGKGNFTIELFREGSNFFAEVEYRSDLYLLDTIEHFFRMFEFYALELAKKDRFDQIIKADKVEIDILDSYNTSTLVGYDRNLTIVDMFVSQAKADPDKLCVVSGETKYTYGEVDRLSNKIAGYIINKGYKKDDVASILIHRNCFMLIATLGVLKAGLVYQPIGNNYPKERINFMIKDASAKLLITEKEYLEVADEYKGNILLLEDIDKIPDFCGDFPKMFPEDRFTLLYTSGSTGVPKGVQLTQGNLSIFAQRLLKEYKHTPEDRWIAYASYGFDANMFDMYGCVTGGGTLYIIDEEMRLDLKRMNAYFEENKITNAFMTTQVARQFATDYANKSLRQLITGGEKLVPCNPPVGYDFINAYGPTECTVWVSEFKVDKLYHRIPIGKSISTCHFYILDKNKQRLPYGVSGELYIAGPIVAKGYLNRPEQNAQAFIENPFDDRPDFKRMYRTGDIVRFLKDGTVDFIGRKDSQVKIRGFRIELTEVEGIIREYPGIKDATVNSYNASIGGMFIAAFIVSDQKIDIDDLKSFIGKNKPSYMIPEVIMQIDKIPLNQNNKVNKKALPTPERKLENIVEPRNEMEKQVFELVKEVLGGDGFGVKNDIFYLGLTSIASIKLITLINEKIGKDIDIKELHEAKTIENIAKFLGESKEEETFDLLNDYPLSKTQEGIFVETMSQQGSTVYNIPLVYEFSKKIDIEKLRNAIEKAINNHPYLKGKLFMNDDGDIRIRRNDDAPVQIEVLNFDCEKPEIKVEPFDLMKDNLYRAKIYVCSEKNYLLLDTHHIASDGTSLGILFDDINKAYLGEELEPEKLDGFDYALLEKKKSTREEIAKEKEYYKSFLYGVDCNSVPRKDYHLSKEAQLKTYDFVLDLDVEELNKFISKNHLSNNVFFNAVFAYSLSKFNGLEDSLYTTVFNGRSSAKLSRSVVMLVKTLPIYTKIIKNQKVLEFINGLKTQIQTSQENTLFSFADIANEFGIKADVMFAYQGDGMLGNTFCGEKANRVLIDSNDAKSTFSVDALEEDNKIKLHFEYRNDFYLEETMEYFGRLFQKISKDFIVKDLLSEVTFVDEKTSKEMDVYNETDDPKIAKSHVELFLKSALANPDKLAVAAIDEDITYKELHRRSNLVANAIIKEGLKANDICILILPRIANAYAATQGVLKSGAAYLPIDPAYPDERITYICEDSEAKLMITTRKLYEEKFKSYNIKCLILEDILTGNDDSYHEVEIDPHQLAYCIYTSGSTGKPKGVMIEHHSLLNYVSNTKHNRVAWEYAELCSVTVSLASLSFDLSVQEQMVPLANGLSVVLASEDEILNPLILSERMKKYHVDFITTTPSYINNVIDIDEVVEAFKNINVLDVGAEALPTSLLRKMAEKGLKRRVHNGYGPTEATVACTMDFVDINDSRVTIGYPLANYKAWIIDEDNRKLPFGAVGELLIGGEGVGRGYIKRPELTKEKFIEFEGYPAYKSGDLARLNYDGRIEFFGRRDNQVKLRGLRVELDEIENQINKYKGINRSVVVVKETPKDGQFLAAYFTANCDIDIEDLKKEIGKSLTPYMIPKVFVKISEIPLTPNGKVNKKALPEPEIKASESKGRKPQNENQEKLYEIYKKVLGIDDLSIDDDFFNLGGTSLSASKVTMLAMKEQINISYSDVFDYPTIASLDAYIKGNSKAQAEEIDVKVEKDIRKALVYNQIEYVDGIKEEFQYKNVLLTGATGFLGIHMLRELIKQKVNVFALVRKGQANTPEERVKGMLVYYFDDLFEDAFEHQIKVIEGDVTDEDLINKVKDLGIDLIINCAAIVKHFSKDDIIERVNYGGVKNLINIAKSIGARLIQTSTLSVAGENVNNKFDDSRKIHEYEIYFGQDVSNKYVHSKIKAEEAIMDAIENEGLDAKVVRVGNLMGRQSDGEFQVNALTNNFMKSLKAYKALGLFPIDAADETIDFSPIDEVAKTILLFAKTPKEYTIFHSANSHEVEMGNVISAMNDCGFPIKFATAEEFGAKLNEFINDEKKSLEVSSLLNYESSDKTRISKFILSNNTFSIKALYRLGYKWPITNEAYIEKMIEALATLGYFDL